MSFDIRMTMAAPAKNLTLRSSDGETFEVDMAVALQMQPIKHMVEDNCVNGVIPLPNVTSSILAKVIKYCKRRIKDNSEDEIRPIEDVDIDAWDANFVKVDHNTLFDLILAANYLHVKNLLDLTCQTFADMIKGMTPEELHRVYNIKNDFAPEEEEQVRRVPEEEQV